MSYWAKMGDARLVNYRTWWTMGNHERPGTRGVGGTREGYTWDGEKRNMAINKRVGMHQRMRIAGRGHDKRRQRTSAVSLTSTVTLVSCKSFPPVGCRRSSRSIWQAATRPGWCNRGRAVGQVDHSASQSSRHRHHYTEPIPCCSTWPEKGHQEVHARRSTSSSHGAQKQGSPLRTAVSWPPPASGSCT